MEERAEFREVRKRDKAVRQGSILRQVSKYLVSGILVETLELTAKN
jgi:hypothetical protein